MPSLKALTIDLIKKLPDNCTLEDIQYELYFKSKVEKGLKDIKKGRLVTEAEMDPEDQIMAQLIWTRTAQTDLHEIYRYISQDSPYYAAQLVDSIQQTVKKLKDFPLAGRVVPEYSQRPLRELIWHNYRVVYKISAGTVYIVAIVHASRDMGSIL